MKSRKTKLRNMLNSENSHSVLSGAPTRPRKSGAETREDLAVEFYANVRLALNQLGVEFTAQERAFRRSRHLTVAPRISGPMLRDSNALGALLLDWSKNPRYLDSNGKPKLLEIAGPGITFEALVRRHFPNTPLKNAVDIACATAEVQKRSRRRIALLGNVMVNFVRSDDNLYFAHANRQIALLLQTIVHNRLLQGKSPNDGRMERIVIGIISREKYGSFMRALRPQIDDLLQRVETATDKRQPKTVEALRYATAVSVGVFVSQEDDWERLGMDAVALAAPVGGRH